MTLRPHGLYPTAMMPPVSTHITRTTKHLKSKGGVAHIIAVLLLSEAEMVEEGMEEDIVEGVEDMVAVMVAETVEEVEEEEMVEVGVAGAARSRGCGMFLLIN